MKTNKIKLILGLFIFFISSALFLFEAVDAQSASQLPTVSIQANPSSVQKNEGAAISWTASNADYCLASGGWGGFRPLSGYIPVWPVFTTSYTISCVNQRGSASGTAVVNVVDEGTSSASPAAQVTAADFTVRKTVRNISRGTNFVDSLFASPGEPLVFGIGIRVGANPVTNLVVSDILPGAIIYRGDLRVDNVLSSGNIFTGLNLGSLSAFREVRITFRGDVAGSASFVFGQTELTNTASASSGGVFASDTAKIIVTRSEVAGAATEIVTGITDNIFLDSFLLPLLITLLIVWLFKARIIRFEQWLDSRKKEYQVYKSNKVLHLKIVKAKAKDG